MNITPDPSVPDVFLATADLDELWQYLGRSPPREIVLLNPHCLRRGSPPAQFAAKISGSIPAVWESPTNLDALNDLTKSRYEVLLRETGRALNAVHGENRSDRYWRILIGPWLHFMVTVGYDRLTRLRHAFAAGEPPQVLGSHESSWVVPVDTLDFQLKISEDNYNFQIASQIMSLLDIGFEKLPLTLRVQPLRATSFADQSMAARISRRFMSRLRIALSHFEARRSNGKIYIVETHFSRAQELKLLLLSGGKVCLNLDNAYPREASPVDDNARDMLFDLIQKDDDDIRVLAGLIRHNLPQCFLENYRLIAKQAELNHQKAITNLIFSTNGWKYSEAFKQVAAGCTERGRLLFGFSLGVGYGLIPLPVIHRHPHPTC